MGLAAPADRAGGARVPGGRVDLRGYGDSRQAPRGYDLWTLAGDVAGLIRALGESRGAVVGHGWGGIIGWTVTALHPRRVSRLVAVGAPHPLAHARASCATRAGRARATAATRGVPAAAAGRSGRCGSTAVRASSGSCGRGRARRGRPPRTSPTAVARYRPRDARARRGALRDGVLPLGGALAAAGRGPPVRRGRRRACRGAGAAGARRRRPVACSRRTAAASARVGRGTRHTARVLAGVRALPARGATRPTVTARRAPTCFGSLSLRRSARLAVVAAGHARISRSSRASCASSRSSRRRTRRSTSSSMSPESRRATNVARSSREHLPAQPPVGRARALPGLLVGPAQLLPHRVGAASGPSAAASPRCGSR